MTQTTPTTAKKRSTPFSSFVRWFDTWAEDRSGEAAGKRIDWMRVVPFLGMHLGCLAVFLVGFSWTALIVAVSLYLARMFGITAFYHRYFAHRAFKTSRVVQFLGAALGNSAVQRGPLWWAAHHRDHHRYSDTEKDVHSPVKHGFFRSHLGWFLDHVNFATRRENIRDFLRYRELRFLDRFDIVVPVVLAVGLFGMGEALRVWAPGLGTSGWQLFVWGFLLSTIAVYHFTFCINSVAHVMGRRRFETKDDSRNNALLAVMTLGEGWHNNHHHYPASARQGFYWWEIDFSYYALKVMSFFGLVWDLKPVPRRMLQRRRLSALKKVARDNAA